MNIKYDSKGMATINIILFKENCVDEERVVYNNTYPIGQFFIDFLDVDFNKVNTLLSEIPSIIPENEDSLSSNIKTINYILQNLSNLYYGFIDEFDDMENCIEYYEVACKKYFEQKKQLKEKKSLFELTETGVKALDEIKDIDAKYLESLKSDILRELLRLKDFFTVNETHQQNFKEAAFYCVDEKNSELVKYNLLQRYYYYESKADINKDYPISSIAPQIIYEISPAPNIDISINDLTQCSIEIKEAFSGDIKSLCYLELIKMIQNGITLKPCEHCGKYFINNKYKNSLYCDRIPEGETKPCHIIAPRKNYKAKLQDNKIAGEYRKRYKKLFSRIKNSPVPTEEKIRFEKWKEQAEPFRDKANQEGISIEDFKKQMDEIERSVRNGR